MNSKVDILLATYNGEKFLPQLLDSILEQTHQDWRLLIRDDGSRDDTLNLIQGFANKNHDRVEVITDSRGSLRPLGNFSEMINHSSADYVLFCDQDDVWLPHKIEVSLEGIKQVESLDGRLVPALAHTDLKVVDENRLVLAESFWRYQNISPEIGETWNRLLVQNVVTGCAMIVNRLLLRVATPISRDAIMHDWWLALVASAVGRVGAISEATILYRQHGENNVGAKNWSPEFIRKRFFDGDDIRAGLGRTQAQARALAEHLSGFVSEEILTVMRGYGNIGSMSPLNRRRFILKHGLLKHGLVRNVGLMFYV